MRTPSPGLACLAATLLLTACAAGYGVYEPPGVDYAGFYDGYYGPVADGYWGDDGVFRFRDSLSHAFRRDEGQHFRREAAANFRPIHGHHAGSTHDGPG
jgi:hypothetical protein